jgi:hypothetical protein
MRKSWSLSRTNTVFPFWLDVGLISHGWSLAARGQAQEGISMLAKGLSGRRATGAVQATTTFALCVLADAYGKLGQPDEGLNCLAEAEQITEATDERRLEADLHDRDPPVRNLVGSVGRRFR